MATPLTVAIPNLKDGQTIAEGQPLFVASVSTLEKRAAMRLLPAYVKRGRLEERVVLGTIGKETLEEAFTYLKDRLDPEEDEFDEAARFRNVTWTPGEAIQDFFTRYLEEAKKVGLTAKTACVFMVSHAPSEVQLKLKEWVKTKEETLSIDEALQLGTTMRKLLSEKGIALDRGCRTQPKVSTITEACIADDGMSEGGGTVPNVQIIRSQGRAGWNGQRNLKCYSCGSSEK